jgi:hypothetical protein
MNKKQTIVFALLGVVIVSSILVNKVFFSGTPLSTLAFLIIIAIHAVAFYLVRDKKPSN